MGRVRTTAGSVAAAPALGEAAAALQAAGGTLTDAVAQIRDGLDCS